MFIGIAINIFEDTFGVGGTGGGHQPSLLLEAGTGGYFLQEGGGGTVLLEGSLGPILDFSRSNDSQYLIFLLGGI